MSALRPRARSSRARTLLVGSAALALSCVGIEGGTDPAATKTGGEEGPAAGRVSRVRPMGRFIGRYSAATHTFTFENLPDPETGAVAPLTFGQRTSQYAGTEFPTVTTINNFNDAQCPNPKANQLCGVAQVTNSSGRLVRNVYVQIVAITPGAGAAQDPAQFAGNNSDPVLPAHSATIGSTSLGVWWFGHVPPGATRSVQTVFDNPGQDFTLVAQMWGDDVPSCTSVGATEAPSVTAPTTDTNCDGVNGSASSGVYVDPSRGSDTDCAANPQPGSYPNDET